MTSLVVPLALLALSPDTRRGECCCLAGLLREREKRDMVMNEPGKSHGIARLCCSSSSFAFWCPHGGVIVAIPPSGASTLEGLDAPHWLS